MSLATSRSICRCVSLILSTEDSDSGFELRGGIDWVLKKKMLAQKKPRSTWCREATIYRGYKAGDFLEFTSVVKRLESITMIFVSA